MKVFILAAVVAGSLGAVPMPRDEPISDGRAIALIRCGDGSGTAFWIARNRIITAEHVVRRGPCSIDGHPLQVVTADAEGDAAELRGVQSPHFLRFSCAPMREGEVMWARGFAYAEFLHSTRLLASAEVQSGFRVLFGRSDPLGRAHRGMSGSPLRDRAGRVRGILNRGSETGSVVGARQLSDTHVCEDR